MDKPKRSTCPNFSTGSFTLVVDKADNEVNGTSAPMVRSHSLDNPQDIDDDAINAINFSKLLQPSSSNYYYTQANRSNREILEKLKRKKNSVPSNTQLDDSVHSKISVLSDCVRRSSYRGPPTKIKSAMKSSGSVCSETGESGSMGSGNPTPKLKRCSFSSVDIREHERIAGDNPCVTSGVPLALGWGYFQQPSVTLDDYEYHRGPSRDKIEMMVPAGVRRSMLRDEFGVKVSEINASMKEVNIVKRGRRHTNATENMEVWVEVAQSANRKFKRFVKGTSKTKEHEKMWEEAHKAALEEYLKANGKDSLGKNRESFRMGNRTVAPSNGDTGPVPEITFQQQGERRVEGEALSF